MEDIEAVALNLLFQNVAADMNEMRNVDHRERIGAFDDDALARAETVETFLRAQHRQRAFEAAEIEAKDGIG
jgi:hypothetical protein